MVDGLGDDEQSSGARSLVPRTSTLPATTREPPKMKLAGSLSRAARDEFVYVGRKGEIRAPWQYRLQRVTGLSIAVGAGAIGVMLSFAIGFPWLSVLYLGALLGVGNVWRLSERLKRGAALLAADRLEEAETELRTLTTARSASRTLRALAWQNLAGVAARRGEHAEALVRVRKCRALFDRMWWTPAGPWKWINRFTEILLLAQLGRLDEARALRRSVEAAPRGEYFRILTMNADLMLAFMANDPTALPDDLHEWSKVALQTTTAELALCLLAWAYLSRGDEDMGRHLLAEARERIHGGPFFRAYPAVHAWMQSVPPAPH